MHLAGVSAHVVVAILAILATPPRQRGLRW
jgi:hypothetical protein